MGKYSVLPDDNYPTVDELAALGRDTLNGLLKQAYRLLGNHMSNRIRMYGRDYRPGNRDFIEFCTNSDIRIILLAFKKLDEIEAKAPKAKSGSPNNKKSSVRLHRRWTASEVIGERAPRELIIKLDDSSGKEIYSVSYSAAPYEGRHMRVIHAKEFKSYEGALAYCLELAEKYSPANIIRAVKKLKRSK